MFAKLFVLVLALVALAYAEPEPQPKPGLAYGYNYGYAAPIASPYIAAAPLTYTAGYAYPGYAAGYRFY